MPEGKVISFQPNEYPELEGLKDGAKVKLEGEATIKMNEDGSGQIMIDSMEIETENKADKSLREMTKTEQPGSNSSSESDGDDF